MHLHLKQLTEGKARKGKCDHASFIKPVKASPIVEEIPIELIIDMERKKREKPSQAPRVELEIPEYSEERPEEGEDDGEMEKDRGILILPLR